MTSIVFWQPGSVVLCYQLVVFLFEPNKFLLLLLRMWQTDRPTDGKKTLVSGQPHNNYAFDDPARFLNFRHIHRNRHFPYLPFERLMAILKRPELCAEELDVFLAIVSWVDAQRADRLPVAPRLLRLVRFQLIPADVLAREVQAIDWLFNNHECMEPVWEAYKYARSS